MKTHARVVVIGGGVAGCSTLYHLARLGWTDAVLVERDELTSGSTWHAAAQVTQFGANQTMVAMKRHSIDLYRELAADPDHPLGYHITGGMRLAHTPAQMDVYRHHVGMARGVGVDFEIIDAAEAARRHPLMRPDGLLGAWWDPLDGDIDPSGLTQALARGARRAGAEVRRFEPVEAIERTDGRADGGGTGEWIVRTTKGEIRCEVVVNATGYRVNEVGRMLGVEHPVTSMEHMYFLTDPIPELQATEARVPIIRDPGADFYSRQEKRGLLVGIYEQDCRTFGMDGIDPDFTMALCPNDLDRCLPNVEAVFERLPALQEVGIHTVVNGPITYTIDGAPLVGPIPGLTNAYACLGLRAGIGEGGGLGKILAELICHGESEWDAWYLDPRRFTSHANTELTRLKAIEDYRREFHYHLPREHRPAGRLAKTTALYPVHEAERAEFGVVAGWERPLFYRPDDAFVDEPGLRATATDAVVGAEIERLAGGCALCEVDGFARFAIEGPGARAFLDRLTCGRLPKAPGRVSLCYLLNERGSVLSEATIAMLGEQSYLYGAAAAAEWHDRDWLERHRPPGVAVRNLTASHAMLVLAGPGSRALLDGLCPRSDLSVGALPWLRCRSVRVGHADVTLLSVSYSGELAFELHVPAEQLYLLWRTLVEAGEAHGLGRFGLYAAESMRLEKGYRAWKADLLTEFDPFESGLERFVDLDKGDFVGREALLERREAGPRARFVTLLVDPATDGGASPADGRAPGEGASRGVLPPPPPVGTALAHAGDPILCGGVQVGSVTSGGWGHRVGEHLALGFVRPDAAAIGTPLEVELLGERVGARVVEPVRLDPEGRRVRA